jgi:hypothetical protein
MARPVEPSLWKKLLDDVSSTLFDAAKYRHAHGEVHNKGGFDGDHAA